MEEFNLLFFGTPCISSGYDPTGYYALEDTIQKFFPQHSNSAKYSDHSLLSDQWRSLSRPLPGATLAAVFAKHNAEQNKPDDWTAKYANPWAPGNAWVEISAGRLSRRGYGLC